MRTRTTLIAVLIIAGLLISACSTAQAAPPLQTDGSTAPERSITVTGTGSVTLDPDIAHISIGVQTQNEDAGAAVNENNTSSQEILDTLADFGIADSDVRTTDFSIWPQQEYNEDGTVRRTVYMVQNTVNVTVRDLDQLGDLLDAVVTSGANNIYGITFDVADRSAAEAEALEAAVADADTQANILAASAQVERGDVLSMSTSQVPSPYLPFYGAGGGGAAMEAAAAPITPGQLEIQATVLVVYQIAQ
jgi:uncharacterized protein YggE